jgi:hypothetical protein
VVSRPGRVFPLFTPGGPITWWAPYEPTVFHLGELLPLPPAFTPRRRHRTCRGNGVQVGLMDEAPGIGLRRRHGLQVGEIGAAGFAHPAGGRTGQGVEPFCLERLAADTAKSRFHSHM